MWNYVEVAKEIAFCLFSNLERIICWGTAIHSWEYFPVPNKSTILIKKLKNFTYQCLLEINGQDEFFQN